MHSYCKLYVTPISTKIRYFIRNRLYIRSTRDVTILHLQIAFIILCHYKCIFCVVNIIINIINILYVKTCEYRKVIACVQL